MTIRTILTTEQVPDSLQMQQHWLYPGLVAIIAPGIYMGIRHNRNEDDNWDISVNFLVMNDKEVTHRLSGLHYPNHMIYLAHPMNRTIVLRAQKLDPTGRPTRTLVEVHTTRQSQKLIA